ncbi:MAG: CDP-glycerol glycerophosphotransferase family protein [Tessaracoccus sp.]|uniref:CDP-glycerol glycerophosphotransferase family protein n=1 Tax=Tessaracoccus sp. TaxID=1971211 RepID=UPI001EBC2C48|nr:CDP-glycerol glycerophosphotransferase family protein [Tessaracoccus sp.]MBK7820150.1 CDP-glycerol glycerophosphotransferase family protein [Tessaracoccus sp.]
MATHLTVTAIEWERVHLTIRLQVTSYGTAADDVPSVDRIFIRDVTQWHDVEWSGEGDDSYVVHINISTFRNRTFLPSGTWKFHAVLSSGEEIGATCDLDAVDALDDYTRVFLFSDNKKAYTVSFGITENELAPLLAMRSYLFSRGGPAAKPSLLRHPIKRLWREAKGVTSGVRKRKVVRMIYDAELKAHQIRRAMQRSGGNPPRPRILFASEQRNGLEGNLLAVRDRMVERGLQKDFDFRYSFRTPQTAERKTLIAMLRKLAQADIVLLDDYFAPLDWLRLNPEAKYIQLWHAGSGFKSIGYSRFGKFGSPALRNAHRHYTYSITGSRHLKHVYAEAFGIEEEAVIPTGLPRIDAFLDPARQAEATERVYRRFPNLKGKRVILFAPTFRGRGLKDASYDYGQIDFEELYDFCGEDTIVAFRMHHFIPGPVPIPDSMRDRLVDVSHYAEGNELLLVSDILITDYSSIIYEFSLLKRPMLFFAYDEQVYSAVRGFHRRYAETAPGKICHTFGELLTALRDGDHETWRGDKFREENFDHIDARSSDRVIDWLILGEPPLEAIAPVTSQG